MVPWPRPDSLEAALLAAGDGDRILLLDRIPPGSVLRWSMLPHRAIGVVFKPKDERWANYVPTRLTDRPPISSSACLFTHPSASPPARWSMKL